MKFNEEAIKQILLKEHYITPEDVAEAEVYAKHHTSSFIEFLLQKGLITKNLLGEAIAESFGIPYVNLKTSAPSPELIQEIPEEVAKKYRSILFKKDDQAVTLATDHPQSKELLGVMKQLFPQQSIRFVYALPDDIEATFVYYQKALDTRFSKIIETNKRIAPEILEEIFDDALLYHASDIHFEPISKVVLVRFRVDGVLNEAGRIPKEYYGNILNRIKVQAGLRIDQHFSAQDGSIRYEKEGNVTDLRASIIPTVEGEKVVLRVLGAYVQGLQLSELGLSSSHQQSIELAASKPFGMILVTGPTGSGKTTTLYSLLKMVNSPNINITTIEDPVEYKMLGINQIQVNQKTDVTFAKGLRSIVRQDPDVILVGEIRDTETAEIGVNAALTGHLLYSTFHANDAATAVPRLLDMDVEPFLLASTLELVVAQRLVRKICNQCRYSVLKTRDDFQTPQLKAVLPHLEGETFTFYEGKKCDSCNSTGYKGRTGIYELIHITPEMEDLILKAPSAQEIWKLAREQGSQSLFEDGMEKVKNGVTTIDELLRVAEPPDL